MFLATFIMSCRLFKKTGNVEILSFLKKNVFFLYVHTGNLNNVAMESDRAAKHSAGCAAEATLTDKKNLEVDSVSIPTKQKLNVRRSK